MVCVLPDDGFYSHAPHRTMPAPGAGAKRPGSSGCTIPESTETRSGHAAPVDSTEPASGAEYMALEPVETSAIDMVPESTERIEAKAKLHGSRTLFL